MGNLLSVERALGRCGAEPLRAQEPDALAHADILVLPGVGAFGDGMAGLWARGLVEPVRAHAAAGRPLLAICLGMQMLFERSSEFGEHEGLGLLPGSVAALPRTTVDGSPLKSPFVGWSPLAPAGRDWTGSVLEGSPPGEWMYFVHSYSAIPADPSHRLADTTIGGHPVTAVVQDGAVVGTQFHPEKSGPAGLRLIEAFLRAYAPAAA
jgi:imidazole glycerol-phosphate synthase subunit HisH